MPLKEAVAARAALLAAAAARAEATGAGDRAAEIRALRASLLMAMGEDERIVRHFGAGVVSDPAVLVGTPAPVGTRVPVWLLLACLRAGETAADIVADLTRLVEEEVDAALAAASAFLDATRAPAAPRRIQTIAEATEAAAIPPEGGEAAP